MLKSHMNAKERVLVAHAQVPANSGHSLHKGTPREAFIREFLESNLPATVAIGTGEIIDSNSQPSAPRNQYDIVIYRRNYPKLDFGGGISGFLIESVIATIEVKSTLTKADMQQAIGAAVNAKALQPSFVTSFRTGHIPPKILNYVVAYDGPAAMSTVYNWIAEDHHRRGIVVPDLPLDASRNDTPAPSIDAAFVLGRGFIYFDNVPTGFSMSTRVSHPNQKWVIADSPDGNLLTLFLFIQTATQNVEGRWLNPLPYMASVSLPQVTIGTT